MFTLIEQGEVYGPEPLGKTSVLLNGGTILKIREVDPHEYLLGGSGEEGFSTQTSEISASGKRLSSFI